MLLYPIDHSGYAQVTMAAVTYKELQEVLADYVEDWQQELKLSRRQFASRADLQASDLTDAINAIRAGHAAKKGTRVIKLEWLVKLSVYHSKPIHEMLGEIAGRCATFEIRQIRDKQIQRVRTEMGTAAVRPGDVKSVEAAIAIEKKRKQKKASPAPEPPAPPHAEVRDRRPRHS